MKSSFQNVKEVRDMKEIDLHMHSAFSEDGEFSPEELVERCYNANIKTMSITDHNTVKATKRGRAEAEKRGIRYISGIEIGASFKDIEFHILGYGINEDSSDFINIENNVRSQCKKASYERLEKINALFSAATGFSITKEDMEKESKGRVWSESWTGEMFAEILLRREEYKDNLILKPYREGESRGDNPYVNFYWDYCSKGKPCYAKFEYPNLEEIIEIIHRNGGKAILAHLDKQLRGKEELLDEIVKFGIDGIEAFSSYHNPSTAHYYYNKVKEYGLISTCGSDYHGKTKPSVFLTGYGELPYNFSVNL